VAALFNASGIAAASIDGTMDAVTRRHLLKQLGANKIKVLTSCALIGEGVDVPSVGGCILLRPTASVGLHLQMIGRCLRPSGSKVAVVLDHVGNCLRLGHHLEPREWTLEGLKKQDREKAPSVKVCPKCYAAMASQARVCGECGHTFAAEVRELEQVDGELVEMAARQRKRQQGTAQSLEDLRQLAQQRGYKRGWAERVYQARLAKRHGIA
jgi:superfamily II DNA or RNA helicase